MEGERKQDAPEETGSEAAEAAEAAAASAEEAAAADYQLGADNISFISGEAEATDALRAELEDTRTQMLRALAEAENVRRRAQRDVTDARQYAVTAFARDLLNVSDNFKRALTHIDEGVELSAELKSLVEGVRMTERELNTVFERHGVKVMDPTGERFDPNRHQAMFEVENPAVPSGTVIQVVQAGAVIGDRTLRPAMVGVSKGGPKPGAEEPASEAPADAAADAESTAGDSPGEGDAA
ncbi:MAG: nucleotide exchange factor GrpE [Pseudomonadota bacterium]